MGLVQFRNHEQSAQCLRVRGQKQSLTEQQLSSHVYNLVFQLLSLLAVQMCTLDVHNRTK